MVLVNDQWSYIIFVAEYVCEAKNYVGQFYLKNYVGKFCLENYFT